MAERHGTNSKHPRRRLAARRPVAAYGRTVQRCLLLILIASAPFLIGERPQSWDVLAGAGALAHVAAFLKFDAWSIFASIGITSPWILPMVGRSARVRGAFLLGSVAVHALLCQLFYGTSRCGTSRCQPLFLVFGRSVVYPTVAKSGSESGYKISGRRKHGQNSLARERGRQSDRALAPRRSAKENPAAV
jgi:hypothetical protein